MYTVICLLIIIIIIFLFTWSCRHLSNNTFIPSDFPPWLESLTSLTIMYFPLYHQNFQAFYLVQDHAILDMDISGYVPSNDLFVSMTERWEILNFKVKFRSRSLSFHICRLCEYGLTLYKCVTWLVFCSPYCCYICCRELESNRLNGTLVIGTSYSNQLQFVDLRSNKISEFNDAGYNIEMV